MASLTSLFRPGEAFTAFVGCRFGSGYLCTVRCHRIALARVRLISFVSCCNFVLVLEGTNFYGGGKRCLVSVVGIRAGRDLFRTFDCGGRDLGLRP